MRAFARRPASRSSGAFALLVIGLLLVTLVAGSKTAEAAEAEVEPIVFEYAAPAGCPSADHVLRQVGAYTTKWRLARPGTAARRFVLRIVRSDASYVGRFDLHEVTGETVGRDVTGESCDDVALGLTIAVALAIDPHAALGADPANGEAPAEGPPSVEGPGRPAPSPKAASDKKSPVATSSKGPSRPPPRASVAVGARGEASSAISGLLALIAAYVEVEWKDLVPRARWFVPVVRASFRQSFTRTISVGPSEADVSWRGGQLELCPSRFALVPRRLSIEGCVASNLGVLSAQARGIPGARVSRRVWFDYGVSALLRWQLHANVFAEATAAVWRPVTRDRLRIEPDGVVTEAPLAGISAGLGIGWRF